MGDLIKVFNDVLNLWDIYESAMAGYNDIMREYTGNKAIEHDNINPYIKKVREKQENIFLGWIGIGDGDDKPNWII